MLASSRNIIYFDIYSEKYTVEEVGSNINKDDSILHKFIQLKNKDIWAAGNKIYKIIGGKKGVEAFELSKNGKPFVPRFPFIFSEYDKGLLAIGKSLLLDFSVPATIKAGSKYPSLSKFSEAYDWDSEYVNIYLDENGDSWIAHLNRLNFKVPIYHFKKNEKKLKLIGIVSKHIGEIFGITKAGDDLWIAGWRALLRWNLSTSQETVIRSGNDTSPLSWDGTRCLFKDRDQGLWIGTQNGLNYKRKNETTFNHYVASSEILIVLASILSQPLLKTKQEIFG
jgi:hypothetical protein